MMRDYVVPLLVPNARRQTMHLAATSESSEGQFDHEEEKSYADLAASCRFFFFGQLRLRITHVELELIMMN